MANESKIRSLINRLARIDAAAIWSENINPPQRAALEYLARANRFSRAPSHVADYLGTTRGTMSQTLKALAQKGYVEERRLETDRRSISYSTTALGERAVSKGMLMSDMLKSLDQEDLDSLSGGLEKLLRRMLAANGGRSFGICRTCRYHEKMGKGGYCSLLSEPLQPQEGDLICHEHEAVAG